jgi:tetratricopeptide (TPR) repeat protein/AAA+ ATPase superfamily predicted ATPase
MPSIFTGTVARFDDRAGYGYIMADKAQDISAETLLLVHRRSLRDRTIQLKAGDRVQFSTDHVPTGILATDVHPQSTQDEPTVMDEPVEEELRSPAVAQSGIDYLSLAIVARDKKRYAEAADLYRKGLQLQPSVGLILSFAAMEKNRNRKTEAKQIYQQGIKLFPKSAKLWEDTGALAVSLGDLTQAIECFGMSLALSRHARQGAKGVLLKLAQAHYSVGSFSSLKSSVSYYQRARGMSRNPLSISDLQQMNIAIVRTQHQRGNVAVSFFQDAGFRISRAQLHSIVTESADLFIQQVQNPELIESYGLAGHLVVRCFFKGSVSLNDLQELDERISEWSRSDLIDEQVAFIVVSSLPEELQRILSGRIEQKNRPQPAIVPVTQSEIETSTNALDTLRAILDRWLFRRDLFATNSPVIGSKFFGRDKPLAELRDSIASSTCAGVYGLRKVGKTSLLQESRRRSAEVGHIVVYIDLLRLPSDVTDCRWLYWRIANVLREESVTLSVQYPAVRDLKWRLGGVFPDFLAIPQGFSIAISFDTDVSGFIDAIRTLPITPRPRIVLLLDEIERLLPNALGKSDFTGFFDFFSYIRGLNQERPEFIAIVTGANASLTETAQFDGRDNPLFNYLKEVYLQHLEPTECVRMIRSLGRGMGLKFTDSSIRTIYQLTGGHPFFARQLCSYISELNTLRPLTIDEKDVTSVTETYLDLRSSHFAEIIERLRRDYPLELKVCEHLARAGGSLSLQSVRKIGGGETVKHLLGYQLVRIQGEIVVLTMQLLTMWLQKRSHDVAD